jgi:hypothetical protein
VRSQLDRFKSRVNRCGVYVPRRSAVLLSISFVALLAALPAGSASAGVTVTPQSSGATKASVLEVPAGELSPILSSIPVRDLGLTEAQLGTLLYELSPELGSSAAGLTGVVSTLLGSNSSATLGELIGTVSGGPLGGLLHPLLADLTPSQVVEALTPTQLNELLANLTGGEPSGTITSAELYTLLSPLAGKLSGEALESLTRILEELQGGLTLQPTTVGSLAEQAGMTPETLATDVGGDLPASAPALEGTLGSEAPLVGVLKGASGLAVALLKPGKGEEGEEGGGEAGEESKSGESDEGGEGGEADRGGGGNGSGGQGGGAGSTTLVVNLPAAQAPGVTTPSGTPNGKLAKVEILSHRVKGSVATIVVQVPAPGKVAVSGKGVTSSSRKLAVAERVTLKVTLSRAGVASLREKHDRLKVTLKASFTPSKGQGSSASVTVAFA